MTKTTNISLTRWRRWITALLLLLNCPLVGCSDSAPAPAESDSSVAAPATTSGGETPADDATAKQATDAATAASDQAGGAASASQTFDPSKLELLHSIQASEGSAVPSLAFAADGLHFVTGGARAALWEVGVEEPLDRLEAANQELTPSDAVRAVALTGNGAFAALGCTDGTIRLYDVALRKLTHKLNGHANGVLSLAFSPDGKTLASSGFDNQIRFWNVDTGEQASALQVDDVSIAGVTYSPDGQMLVSTGQQVFVWDLAQQAKKFELEGNLARVGGAAYSPNGERIATAEFEFPIKVWDAKSGKLLKKLEGHEGSTRSVAFTADGQTIASASDDGTIKVWNAQTGLQVKTFQVEGTTPQSVAWSVKNLLAAAFDDGTVIFYGLPEAASQFQSTTPLAKSTPEGTPATTNKTEQPAESASAAKTKPPTAKEPQQPAGERAATVADAMRVIDLRKLAQMPQAEATQATPTRMSMTAPGTVKDAQEFYEKTMVDLGWKPVVGESGPVVTAEYAQLDFSKEGFQLGISLYQLPEGKVNVGLNNYGNVAASTLPQPAESTRLFVSGWTVIYVTAASVPDATAACLKQLAAAGWQAYTRPFTQSSEDDKQRTITLKKEGVELTAFIVVAPAQQGKTSVQYSLIMLGDELPAPASAAQIEFLESPLQLNCVTPDAVAETLEFYEQALAARGWQSQGEPKADPKESVAVFQRSEGLPVVLRITRQGEAGPTKVTLAEFEMPRVKSPLVEPDPATVTKTPDETPVPAIPETGFPLLDRFSKITTYEDWLKKNKFQPSPERLQQYAKEMEKLANEFGGAPPEE